MYMCAHLVVSDFLRSHRLYPARLLCPLHSPGKNTGVGCHFLLQGIFPTQRLNTSLFCLLDWQEGSLPLVHLGRPIRKYMASLKIKYSRVSQFHEIVPYLLQKHDNSHLEAKVYQTATRMTLKQATGAIRISLFSDSLHTSIFQLHRKL